MAQRIGPRRNVHIALDTNAIHTDSERFLVRRDVADLLRKDPRDVQVIWYLPSVVRREREYQMWTVSQGLLPNHRRLQVLMGATVLTAESLLDAVHRAATAQMKELNLRELSLDVSAVDWLRLIDDALYRRPPFEPGDKEKGLRDALILEEFRQLLEQRGARETASRLFVLVTSDDVLMQAATARIKRRRDVHLVRSIGDAESLLNTFAAQLQEELVAHYREQAETLFFVPGDNGGFFYRSQLDERLTSTLMDALRTAIPGYRGQPRFVPYVDAPTFIEKKGLSISWTSRVVLRAQDVDPWPVLLGVDPRGKPSTTTGTIQTEGGIVETIASETAAPQAAFPGSSGLGLGPARSSARSSFIWGERGTFLITWTTTTSSARTLGRPRLTAVQLQEVTWNET